jgi:predicted O-methyltransferase YrrM
MLEYLFDNLPDHVKWFRRRYDPVSGGYKVPAKFDFKGIDSDCTEGWDNLPIQYDSIELPVADAAYSIAINNYSSNILETGTSRGFSTSHLAVAAKANNGTVITIDPHPAPHLLWENSDLSSTIKLIRKLSTDAKTDVQSILNGQKLDLLFLDSFHSYHNLANEILTYEPLLKINGIILLHDTLFYDSLAYIVHELKQNSRFETITIETHRRHYPRSRCTGLTIIKKINYGSPISFNYFNKLINKEMVCLNNRDISSTPLLYGLDKKCINTFPCLDQIHR